MKDNCKGLPGALQELLLDSVDGLVKANTEDDYVSKEALLIESLSPCPGEDKDVSAAKKKFLAYFNTNWKEWKYFISDLGSPFDVLPYGKYIRVNNHVERHNSVWPFIHHIFGVKRLRSNDILIFRQSNTRLSFLHTNAICHYLML
jgi:hypothetical protein